MYFLQAVISVCTQQDVEQLVGLCPCDDNNNNTNYSVHRTRPRIYLRGASTHTLRATGKTHI